MLKVVDKLSNEVQNIPSADKKLKERESSTRAAIEAYIKERSEHPEAYYFMSSMLDAACDYLEGKIDKETLLEKHEGIQVHEQRSTENPRIMPVLYTLNTASQPLLQKIT